MENFFAMLKQIWMMCSADYRQQEKERRGKELWEKVTKNLPPLTPMLSRDMPEAKFHFAAFKEYLLQLSPKDIALLHAWLAQKVHYWQHNFTEHTTATIENIEGEILYGFESHFEALKKFEEFRQINIT